MKQEKFYNTFEIAEELNTSYKNANKIIHRLRIKPEPIREKKTGSNLYSENSFVKIKNSRKQIIIKVPIYITQAFYIYESKMNFENN